MKDIFKKNIDSMEKTMPLLKEKCLAIIDEKDQDFNVNEAFAEQSAQNETILGVIKDSRKWYLNSRYYAQKAVDIWTEGIEDIHYKSIVTLCGISNGMYLRSLMNVLGKENRVIVYEPDTSIFFCLIENVDLTDLFADERVTVFVEGLNMDVFSNYFKTVFSFELVNLSRVMVCPGYETIYAERLNQFIGICENEVGFISAEKNTLEDIGEEICDNIISNIWKMANASSMNELRSFLQEQGIHLEEVPAIIVSAGPSLDKNIDDLKLAKGKALLVATDSAVKNMLCHGIVPDLMITVDSHKPLTLFEDERTKNIPLVVCGQSRHEVLIGHTGKMFVFSGDNFTYKLFGHFSKEVDGLLTGGSVANNAFSFVKYLGIRKIILAGQDLAFTNSKKHAENAYQEKEIVHGSEEEYVYVDDYEGNPILTFTNFKLYKEWFESQIKSDPDMIVVNATEGGANIVGAPNMTMKQAINQFCNGEFDSAVLQQAPELFDDQGIEAFYMYLQEMADRCTLLEQYFHEGIELYAKLRQMLLQGSTDTAAFSFMNKRIEEINSMDRAEPIMELVSMYCKKQENKILAEMYQEEDGIQGAIGVTYHGAELLNTYLQAIERIRRMLDLLLRYEVSQDIYEVNIYDITFVA